MQLLTENVLRQIVCISLLCFSGTVQFGVTPDVSASIITVPDIGQPASNQDSVPARIIRVPSDFKTIAEAVEKAINGDWIIIAPGIYHEREIVINKSVAVSSEWKMTGDEKAIEQTIIDAGNKTLFTITADSVEISGLHIRNGDHTLNILANVVIRNNHFVNNLDAMSFEGPGGGYVGYNVIENDRDDGIDLDIGAEKDNPGSDITIEHNTIVNSHDDGIEIRLFSEPDQNIKYDIHNNIIVGSKNAGIQLISYDVFTGKEFRIHHNIFRGCKTALGCMEGSKTREDLSGATMMDEWVFFFNNTVIGNQMGATGGNQIIAINNVIAGNTQGGFKKFGPKSVIVNNLFYGNGGEDFVEVHESAKKDHNIFSLDPKLDQITFEPAPDSPCLGAGKRADQLDAEFSQISEAIGARLTSNLGATVYSNRTLVVDAGDDIILRAPKNEVTLSGRIVGAPDADQTTSWKVDPSRAGIQIENPAALETKVSFSHEGIYQFTLAGSDGKRMSSDSKTIRYTHGGDGKAIFLNADTNIIEAEQYGYLYGNVAEAKGDPSAAGFIEAKMTRAGERNLAEYFIGTSENSEWTIWLRVKKPSRGKSTIALSFNHNTGQTLSVSNNKEWHWIKVPGKTNMTAGEWQLLIAFNEGLLQMDKLLITRDHALIPD